MTPRDLRLGQSTIPNDMNSSRGNRGFLEGKEPHSDSRDCAFFQSHAGFGGPNHSKKYYETIALLRPRASQDNSELSISVPIEVWSLDTKTRGKRDRQSPRRAAVCSVCISRLLSVFAWCLCSTQQQTRL